MSSPIQAASEMTATRRAAIWPVAAGIAILLALQFQLVLTRSINWDEFHFLKLVFDFDRGELSLALQTLHVRMFAWIPALDLPGVDQIIRFYRIGCATVRFVAAGPDLRPFLSIGRICVPAWICVQGRSARSSIRNGCAGHTDPRQPAASLTIGIRLSNSCRIHGDNQVDPARAGICWNCMAALVRDGFWRPPRCAARGRGPLVGSSTWSAVYLAWQRACRSRRVVQSARAF